MKRVAILGASIAAVLLLAASYWWGHSRGVGQREAAADRKSVV